MTKDFINRMYILARLSLSDANKGLPFAPSKAQAMADINFWSKQLRSIIL